jgi:hypothetical protein
VAYVAGYRRDHRDAQENRDGLQSIESAAALQYALTHPEVPAMIAYDRAKASDFAHQEGFGIKTAEVGGAPHRDVSAVVAAVDRSCAAYECLQTAVETSSS